MNCGLLHISCLGKRDNLDGLLYGRQTFTLHIGHTVRFLLALQDEQDEDEDEAMKILTPQSFNSCHG